MVVWLRLVFKISAYFMFNANNRKYKIWSIHTVGPINSWHCWAHFQKQTWRYRILLRYERLYFQQNFKTHIYLVRYLAHIAMTHRAICSNYPVWPDTRIKCCPIVTQVAPKGAKAVFCIKGGFKLHKICPIFVLILWKNMSKKLFKSSPIWSHCHYQT